MIHKLDDKLNKRIEEGTYRSLSSFNGIDFWSNDYLGLSKVQLDLPKSETFGATGSRMISGNSKAAEECENAISLHFESEAALLYNSGYDANVGFFSCIPQKGDLVIYDSDIHASVRDGIRLSFAKAVSFSHNSLEDLEKKLQLAGDNKYVAIESLYSMRGDFAPIVPLLNLCDKYDAHLIVDEAHSAGLYGDKGKGIVHALAIESRVFARLITFGKAFGCHGAAIVSSQFVKNFLVNFSRSFIYTTALPDESYYRIKHILNYSSMDERRTQLFENIKLFRNGKDSINLSVPSDENSPIQIVEIGTVEEAKKLAKKLRANECLVKEILSPTVPNGQEGIRICIHSDTTFEQISKLLQLLQEV